MLIAAACVLQRAMTFDKDSAYSLRHSIVLLITVGTATIYHCVADEQVVHQLSFVALIALVALRTRSLIRDRVSQSEARKHYTRLTIFGASK